MPILEIMLPLKASIKRIKEKYKHLPQAFFTVADIKKITEKFKSEGSDPKLSALEEEGEQKEAEEDEILTLTMLPASSYHIPLVQVTLNEKNYDKELIATKSAITEVTKELLEFSIVSKNDPNYLYFSFPLGTSFGPARFYMRPEKVLENLIGNLCLALSERNLKFMPCLPHITIAILDKNCDKSRKVVTRYYESISKLIYETATEIMLMERKKKLETFRLKSPIQVSEQVIEQISEEIQAKPVAVIPETITNVHTEFASALDSAASVPSKEKTEAKPFTPVYSAVASPSASSGHIRNLQDELSEINESLQVSSPAYKPSLTINIV